ncbi:MAG: hypothetical protein J1F41_03455 [Lachnospiraceae bacterium]|nr:hypothetical protein [Lachnospiraceae bacterium]
MIKVIAKEGALKVFYYLMAVDGVTTFEQERFQEIGIELLGETFSEIKETIIAECEEVIDAVEVDDERYDVIQEGIDQALNEMVKEIEDGVVPRLLIWNMLTLAHSDSDYSENENRLINHVARILQIDRSVLAEMKHLISVAHSLQEEKETLENSTRSYAEVRPLIDEVEKRQQTIVEAAKYLITDDMVIDVTEEEEKKENVVLTTGKKIGDSVIAGSKKVGESMAPVAKELGAKAMAGATGLKEGAGKLFSKIKDVTK